MLSRYRHTARMWSDPIGRALFRLRLRPNHLTVMGLAVSLIAAAGFFLAVRAFRGPAPTTEAKATPRASPQSHQTGGGPSPKQRQSPLETGMFGAMLDAIRGSSPPGWEFSLQGDRLDGDWRLDGDANDGAEITGILHVDGDNHQRIRGLVQLFTRGFRPIGERDDARR